MSVGLLIITHAPFGAATLEAASSTFGPLPMQVKVMDIATDSDLEQEKQRAGALLKELDQGDGVLLLTDLYGATPSNIASGLIHEGKLRILVSGLNLAMLIRIMNYSDETLQELADRAVSGGHNGIFVYPPLA